MYLRDQLVTLGDVQQFRDGLLNDLKQLLPLKHPVAEKKWLKSHEVRKLLKISPGTLQKPSLQRQITIYKSGRYYLLPLRRHCSYVGRQ